MQDKIKTQPLAAADVARLLRDASPAVRAETAAKVANEFTGGSLSESERAVAEDIFRVMMRDVEVRVRESLARAVKVFPWSCVVNMMRRTIEDGCNVAFKEPVAVRIEPVVRPSVRCGTPTEPISNAELQAARRLLKRTSFRRNSVGWRQFMDRLSRRR